MKRGKNKFITVKGGLLINLSSFYCLFFLLSACSPSSIYEKNTTIDNQLWYHRQIPQYAIHTINTNQNFDIFVNLRHSSSYKFSNLSLIIEEVSPKKEAKTYRLEIQLVEPDGRWKGVGTGNVLSYQIPFLKDHHFADTGTYMFKIKQNMSSNPLSGVLDIGIQVVK